MAFIAALVGLFACAAFGQQAATPTFVERNRVVAEDTQRPLITRLPAYPQSKRFIAPQNRDQASSPAAELPWRSQTDATQRWPVRQAAAEEPLDGDRAGQVRPAINLVPAESFSVLSNDASRGEAAPRANENGPSARLAAQVDRPRFAPHVDDEVSPIPPAIGLGRSTLQADDLVQAPLAPLPPRGNVEELDGSAPAPAAPAPVPAAPPSKPCPDESYRDTDCCRQRELCGKAWDKTQVDPVSGFHKEFLDITPLYKPDVSYQAISKVDQAKFRRDGLSLSNPRIWKYADGRPVMINAGEVVKLGDAIPAGAMPLGMAAVEHFDARTGVVHVKAADGATFALPLGELNRDDQFWVQGRPWQDLAGNVIATGRLENYKWGRVYIRTNDGQIVAVPMARLGADELCYVDAYWGDGIGLPPECRLAGKPKIRDFTLLTFTWKASALCHKPLYFEEVQLERYGHSAGPIAQPVISGAHFFANIAILPYKMGIHPPTECMYALGYYRPGSCALT